MKRPEPTGPSTVLARALAGPALAAMLAGCTADAITVQSAGLSEEAAYLWLASTTSEEKERFSTEDEKVTLHVRLAPNFVGMYQWFVVEWVAPHGRTYLRAPARTRWGSHQELITEMPVRGEPPARFPGRWTVRLRHGERVLVEREFEISTSVAAAREREGEAPAGPAPPVARAAAPGPGPAGPAAAPISALACPPLPQPPGACVDVAPQEIGFHEGTPPVEPKRPRAPDPDAAVARPAPVAAPDGYTGAAPQE